MNTPDETAALRAGVARLTAALSESEREKEVMIAEAAHHSTTFERLERIGQGLLDTGEKIETSKLRAEMAELKSKLAAAESMLESAETDACAYRKGAHEDHVRANAALASLASLREAAGALVAVIRKCRECGMPATKAIDGDRYCDDHPTVVQRAAHTLVGTNIAVVDEQTIFARDLEFAIPLRALVVLLSGAEAQPCMQPKDEPEFWCKHDGSAHSIYCPLREAQPTKEPRLNMDPQFKQVDGSSTDCSCCKKRVESWFVFSSGISVCAECWPSWRGANHFKSIECDHGGAEAQPSPLAAENAALRELLGCARSWLMNEPAAKDLFDRVSEVLRDGISRGTQVTRCVEERSSAEAENAALRELLGEAKDCIASYRAREMKEAREHQAATFIGPDLVLHRVAITLSGNEQGEPEDDGALRCGWCDMPKPGEHRPKCLLTKALRAAKAALEAWGNR